MAGHNIKLSILIPTVPRRKEHLERLLEVLNPQITDEVELLVLMDNKKRTLWAKRQNMLELAKGEYVVFIDDDDEITNDYVYELLIAILNNSDVICFWCEVSIDGGAKESVVFSSFIEDSFTNGIHYRKPNHLMCFKRETAMKEKYNDMLYWEDFDYSQRIWKHIKTETIIDKTMYHYKSIPSNSECK